MSAALALYVRDLAVVQGRWRGGRASDPPERAAKPPCVRPAWRT